MDSYGYGVVGVLQKPANGRLTQGYSNSHRALDFGWRDGTTVYAAAAGYVSWDWTAGYGNRLSINHGTLIQPSTVTRYAHLHSMRMKSGWVIQGQPIGTMGETGTYPEGVHLHFELLVGSGIRLARVDPSPYLTDTSGGKPIPIPNQKDDDMKILFNTDNTNDATRRALVGEFSFQILTSLAATEERKLYGDPINVSGVEWDRIKARTEARIATLPIGAGAFTAADRAMLDDIASKGELTQALTSTVQAVNNQAAVNKQEILNAIDEIDAGAPQNLSVTLTGTAAAV